MQKPLPARSRFSSLLPFLASFFLPFTLFLAICALHGVLPFGGRSLMLSDMYNQYTAFFTYMQRMAAEGNDFFYSLSAGMGGSMLSLAATYLTSPFVLLVFLCTPATLLGMLTWMLAVKIGLCGLTAYALLRAMDTRGRGGAMALAFSTAYALMGYVMHYGTNVMWLDGVILLPLVALGLLRMVRERRIGLYVAALAAALFTNYYIGYMLCLFSVPFFACLCLMDLPAERRWAWLWPRMLRFAGASLAAGGAAAFVLLPTLLALAQTDKASLDALAFAFAEMFPLAELPNLFVTGMGTFEGAAYALPNVFCGVLTAVMAALFFANRRIRLREKALSGALLALLLAGFHVRMFDTVWHAFNIPISYPYRYAFLFSFVMIWLAWRCFVHAEGICAKHALVLMPLSALWCLAATAFPLDWRYFEALLACACLALVCAALRGNKRRAALVALAVLQLGHLLLNGSMVMQMLQRHAPMDAAAFEARRSAESAVVEQVRAMDGDLYRMEVSPALANGPMRYAYNGISLFSSTHNAQELAFLSALGVSANGSITSGYDNWLSDAFDSLLGIRYLATTGDVSHKRYTEAFAAEAYTVYENAFALPLGFAASAGILACDLSGSDPFAALDAVYAAILGDEEPPIFVRLPSHDLPALTNAVDYPSPHNDGGTVYAASGEGGQARVTFSTVAQLDDGPVFGLVFASDWMQRAEMFAEGRSLGGFTSLGLAHIFPIDDFWADDLVELTVLITDAAVDLRSVAFYQEDVAAFEERAARIAEHGADVRKVTSSRLAGAVTIPQELPYLLLTLPYDASWRAYVDGRAVRPVRAMGALLAVPMEPGVRTFELRYVPSGFVAGCAVTAATLCALAAYALVHRIRKNREKVCS